MKLRLETKYASFEPFPPVEIPNFTILTGVNGAGKTQILTAINENSMQVSDDNTELKSKKYVSNQTLSPNDSEVATKQNLTKNIEELWTNYSSLLSNFRMSKYYRQNPSTQFRDTIKEVKLSNIVAKIASKLDKQPFELQANDFFDNNLLFNELTPEDIFHQNLSVLFKSYQYKFDANQYGHYRFNQFNDKEARFIPDEEFIKIHGEPPWDLINEIIAEAKLDYRVNSPVNLPRDASFELKLINNFNNAEVKFSELSSGEKVIMSLAFALYNSKFDIEFPEILLMDEPDASLHPSMAKQFLNVIQKVFVQDKGVKVIMTTHSPSTVALAPEEAIFIVNKTGERIEKASSKDAALKILTTGVPSFSVNYENRRQVFVESVNDVYFYEKMYEKLSSYLEPEISLSFISSGESRTDRNGQPISNCEQVVNITKTLTEAGNKFVFGIIDWDTNNSSNDYIKVLGEGKRYNIENYIFDPIFISALLFQEQENEFTRENLKLENNESYSDFKHLTSEQLQVISDFLTNKVAEKIKPTEDKRITVQFLIGKEIQIPMWYLHYNGHYLERCLKEVFPKLGKFNQEQALKKEVIDKYIDNIPELISSDILEVFKQIQKL